MTRAQKRIQNERFRLRYERDSYKSISRVLGSIRAEFVDVLTSKGVAAAQSRMADSAHFEEMIAGVILKLHVAAGTAKAKQVYGDLTKEPMVKAFGIDKMWADNIIKYFNKNLYNKIVTPIYSNTRDYFNTKIKEMVQDGQSIEWLTQQVENKTFEAYRARVIARTESNRAINYGADMAARDSGFETIKEWVSVHDSRTRHSHLLLDGMQIGINESFKRDLRYPGDPDAPGAETINCRCHVEYRPARDSQGLLVPSRTMTSPSQSQRRQLERVREQLQRNRPIEVNPFAAGPIKL